MKPERIIDLFRSAHPKAVDIPMAEYQGREHTIAGWAQTFGYRFAGERLGRAVFTTKAKRADAGEKTEGLR